MRLSVIIAIIIFLSYSCRKIDRPKAGYTPSLWHAKTGQAIAFENTSTESEHFVWSMGDGQFYNTKNVIHKYSEYGIYNVELRAFTVYKGKTDIKSGKIGILETDLFIDERDGEEYEIIKLAGNWWMARNLAYKPDSGGFYTYPGVSDYVETYGYLYDYETACNSCPEGWHMPDETEWKQMINYVGSEENIGIHLMKNDKGLWFIDPEGSVNASGFSALPGGQKKYETFYRGINYFAAFWASAINYQSALTVKIDTEVFYDYEGVTNAYSVRCVLDR